MSVGFWLSLCVLQCSVLHSIKLVKVTVPDIVQSGSQVILTCAYSVSPGEYIDSIKWYLNNSECYRIVPGLTQDRVLTFPPGGACISLPQSGILRPGTHRLVINNASQLCSGKYICQVTESRPPFKTEQAAAVLHVLERPAEPPRLSGMEAEYDRGSILNVTCQSSPGLPPPALEWAINGQKVPAFSTNISYQADSARMLAITMSRLVVKLTSSGLPSRITVKCTAVIGSLYSESVWGRAVFIKPPVSETKPVLGEPLMSGCGWPGPGAWGSLLGPLTTWSLSRARLSP